MAYRIRTATLDDEPKLQTLIERSVRELSANDYSSKQIEVSLRNTFGIDTQLIKDETYFAVEDSSGEIIGCGGWSYRRTLFGSDHVTVRDAADLDSAKDPAKIRAFFVDPTITRAGIGSMILSRCETEAAGRGFHKLELMSTLPGKPFYAAKGYTFTEDYNHELGPDLVIEFVSMRKTLSDAEYAALREEKSPESRAKE